MADEERGVMGGVDYAPLIRRMGEFAKKIEQLKEDFPEAFAGQVTANDLTGPAVIRIDPELFQKKFIEFANGAIDQMHQGQDEALKTLLAHFLMGDRLIVIGRKELGKDEITFEWKFEPREDK